MPERFEPVADTDTVFRLIERETACLPASAVLPLSAWFSPSKKDLAEAVERKRVPGWSMWNQSLATVSDIRALVERPDSLAFGLRADAIRAVGTKHERTLDVLADPVDAYQPRAGWDAHCVLEGLARPKGLEKTRHKDLQADLASACIELR